ncbi:hypothetical protein GO755_16450 [Spirosoma sp. HMF4905]|uniref:Chromosome condensation regulator RCC1 n=1 Tax=Spirosoma arboris TaxID=2682092 RepID=A0A7K1SCV5_9BACT|nr:hypothetical protein [Spirosoma arboris]MVM31639.1 hypothetical protein [Spirosoma arboris]
MTIRIQTLLRQATGLLLILMAFTQLAQAQDGFVGDGFGGRSWYKRSAKLNIGNGFSVGVINGQLYMWGGLGSSFIYPVYVETDPSAPYPVKGAAGTDYSLLLPASSAAYVNSPGSYGVYPYAVPGFADVKLISLGYSAGALIRTDGTGWVFGLIGNSAQYTYGSTSTQHTPIQVISNAKFVSQGPSHTVFVKNDGTVWSLGSNKEGAFGDGTNTSAYGTTPVQMTGITNAVRVATFGESESNNTSGTVILKSDKTVWATGGGTYLMSASVRNLPVKVPSLSNVVDIKATYQAAAALTTTGDVYTWGRLVLAGVGATTISTPVKINFPDGTPPMVAIEAKGDDIFSLDENHTLWVWGTSSGSARGNNPSTYQNYSAADSDFLTPFIAAKNVEDIVAGSLRSSMAYLVRTPNYPANERLWFASANNAGNATQAQTLNPDYFFVQRYSTDTHGSYWYTSPGSGFTSLGWYPANPGAWGLDFFQTPTTIAGTVDCASTAIVGNLVAGTASNVLLKVTATVSTTGTGTFSVSGSGLTAGTPATYTATATGPQTFYLPMTYDGTALGATTFTFSGLGACSADLSGITKRPVLTPITPLSNCVAITPGTLTK